MSDAIALPPVTEVAMNASDPGRRDWRETIHRLREESNDALREIWAAKRVGLDEPEDDDPGDGEPERDGNRS